MVIRRAKPEEASILTDLTLRSKAVWGYDNDFIEQCRQEFTRTPDYITSNLVYVAESDGEVVGYYGLIVHPPTAKLDALFVSPDCLKHGCGRILWRHAMGEAICLGVKEVTVDADPNAEKFYERMGAQRIGMAPSGSIPGRFLPLMRYIVS